MQIPIDREGDSVALATAAEVCEALLERIEDLEINAIANGGLGRAVVEPSIDAL